MAKMTVISSRELVQHKRWDADFFIALKSVEARYHQLERDLIAKHHAADQPKRSAEEEAKSLLRNMQPIDLKPIRVLGRGRGQFDKMAQYDRIIEEYPILSLALLEPTIADAIARIEQHIAQYKEYLAHLQRIGHPGNAQT